jgi:phosphate transport system protein
MKDHFMQEIDELKTNLTKMASLVDERVERAIKALETGDIELCKGMKSTDVEVDAFENSIKTQCENILALFQPVATDLRFIISSLMINSQLERCGDIAVNISQRVKKTVSQREFLTETQIVEMGKRAKEMLKDAIDAFLNLDIKLAEKVIDNDSSVDKMNKQIFNFVVEKMKSEPAAIETGAHLIVLTRQIERLADHATNIAEEAVFYKNAIIIAHKKKLEKHEES